jgi:hypothetical protein
LISAKKYYGIIQDIYRSRNPSAFSIYLIIAVYVFLDIFLTIAHIAVTLFNLTGWIWKRTRKAHLLVLSLTLLSWLLLGFWYGWGYCVLTDWHWEVKEKLGEKNLPASFIKYLGDKLTGRDLDPLLVDNITLGCLVFSVVAAVYVNFIRRKKTPTGSPIQHN